MFHYNFNIIFSIIYFFLFLFFFRNNHIIIFFILFFLTIISTFIYFIIRNLFFFFLIFFLYARGLLLFFSYRIILSQIKTVKTKLPIKVLFFSFFFIFFIKNNYIENIFPFSREFTSLFRILFLCAVIFFLLICLYIFLQVNIRYFYYKSKLK